MRRVHLMCHLWAQFHSATLCSNLGEEGVKWRPFQHAYLPHRSRESAMLIVMSTVARLRADEHCMTALRDMTNASASTIEKAREATRETKWPDELPEETDSLSAFRADPPAG